MTDQAIEIQTGPAPDSAVIWLHGLGADGNDFVPIVPELKVAELLAIRFVFPHAPVRPVTCNGGYEMRAWYDIYSLEDLDQEDHEGLQEAQHIVETLIQQQMDRGIDSRRIILLGFSQGGAVVLHTGLRYSQPLGGIGALSTYLPLADLVAIEKHTANAQVPVFMAHGQYDPVVSFTLGGRSCQALKEHGYNVEWRDYPMEHGVCPEEIDDINQWLTRVLNG